MRGIFRLAVYLVLFALVVAGLAIWAASHWVDVKVQDGEAIATLTLDEKELTRIARWTLVDGGPAKAVLEDITRVTLQGELLRVEGAYTSPSGARKLGWVDLALTAEQGALVAQVRALDRDGLTGDQASLAGLNERLSETMRAGDADRKSKITAVRIHDGQVSVEARTPLSTDNK